MKVTDNEALVDLIVERSAGATSGDGIVACVRTPGPGGKGADTSRPPAFSLLTSALEAMAAWLGVERGD